MMRTSALMLNVFVSLVAFFAYARNGYFNWRLFLPFAVASIPLSFLGASIVVEESIYKKILGVCLIFPILRLTGFIGKESEEIKPFNWIYALLIGGIIGLISGMIGIGGGIILSPVILLFHWAKMKETAAVSSLFILVNSISGLSALVSNGIVIEPQLWMLLCIVTMGGLLGAFLGATKFNNRILSYILAFVLLIASIKLIVT
jgi:uncharacterized membrane protein YfcA